MPGKRKRVPLISDLLVMDLYSKAEYIEGLGPERLEALWKLANKKGIDDELKFATNITFDKLEHLITTSEKLSVSMMNTCKALYDLWYEKPQYFFI